ncbi:hypothetical protein [Paracidobacterium acidisoli]|uniref:Uncharacterized protein n=1 Tax=Paracidobacterium acidisoli TaxID=2303751 RepID=A0A372ITX1_9BACT|nr:hypothetical protein [Paracidobacterium acidisoli]MBT9329653.1 hypothetical protein [Paracidobacterium acidisoli]
MQPPGTLPNGRRVAVPPQFYRQQQPGPSQQIRPGQPPAPSAAPSSSQGSPASSQPVPAPAAAPGHAPSLSDKPAQPAQVHLTSGDLSVQADNSSLVQILHDVSSSTGMTVDGLGKDQRVFGSYGPAKTSDVLSALLEDSGYNVMMVGATSGGAPRQLFLTPRNASTPAAGAPQPRPAQDEAEDDAPTPEPPPPMQSPDQPEVRTPQQMLQQLQRMRQQRQQDEQQEPQQPPQQQ